MRNAERTRGGDRRPPHQTWTIVLAGLGIFMTALDNMVVTTALPVLRVSLHAGLSELEWTINAYLLAFACLLLTGAALGDRLGRRRMFAGGIALFTAASAAAALSPSVGLLIAARVVQGAGAAIAFPLTLTLISEAFPVQKRGAAIGMWGAIAGLAVAFGPVIGGAIVNGINWHWIFWVNVPVGVALVALTPSRLSESFGPRPRVDTVGVVLAAAGSLGITWALVRANTVGWGSFEALATLIAGAALIAGFLGWERRAPSPMIPLELFRRRGFVTANVVSFFMYAGLFGSLFLMTQLLQFALGHSPLVAGLMLLPWTAAAGIVSPIAGALADRYGNRPFMTAGLAMQAIGLGWIAAVASTGTSYTQLGLALGVRRRRHRDGVPDRRQRGARLGAARRGWSRLGDQQHDARARRRARSRCPGRRLCPPRDLRLAAAVHRRVQRRALGRGRALRARSDRRGALAGTLVCERRARSR